MMVLRPVKKNVALLLSILLILNSLVLCVSAKEKADTVYINGNIFTVDSGNSKATAMAINGQHLMYVGDNSKAEEFIGNKTKVIDLEGKTVLPGIIEGHMHFPMLGENLIKIDAYWKPKQEIIDAVKVQAAKLHAGEWIEGFGWNNEVW